MRSSQILAAVLAIGGLAAVCAAWVSSTGMTHTNDSTCPSETCQRTCRLCCLHFHPDNTSSDYLTCIGGCTELPSKCMEPGDPGGVQ